MKISSLPSVFALYWNGTMVEISCPVFGWQKHPEFPKRVVYQEQKDWRIRFPSAEDAVAEIRAAYPTARIEDWRFTPYRELEVAV